ncbi:hypothetical protein ACEWFN_26410, partial [Klebsiella quasipneumoniae]
MSDILPLFQPESSFSYSTIDLAAEGISIWRTVSRVIASGRPILSRKKGSQLAALVSPILRLNCYGCTHPFQFSGYR